MSLDQVVVIDIEDQITQIDLIMDCLNVRVKEKDQTEKNQQMLD